MKAVVVFSPDSNHPLRWLLHRDFRHCFVVAQQHDDGPWVLIDSAEGLPYVSVLGIGDFDPEAFYAGMGLRTLRAWQRARAPRLPLCVASCVGLTKAVLGIEAPLVQTPRGLYHYLLRELQA